MEKYSILLYKIARRWLDIFVYIKPTFATCYYFEETHRFKLYYNGELSIGMLTIKAIYYCFIKTRSHLNVDRAFAENSGTQTPK